MAAVLRLADQRERRQPAEQPEPDAEDLAPGAPRRPSEPRHAGEREEGVGKDGQAEHPAGGHERDQLQPDDDQEADDGRPGAPALRIGSILGLAAGQAEPRTGRGQQPVERAERVEPGPGRPDQC